MSPLTASQIVPRSEVACPNLSRAQAGFSRPIPIGQCAGCLTRFWCQASPRLWEARKQSQVSPLCPMGNQLQLALRRRAPTHHHCQHSIYPVPLSLLSSFPFLATALHMAPRQNGLCLPPGTGLAHILPPIPWKPWLLLVRNTLTDRA